MVYQRKYCGWKKKRVCVSEGCGGGVFGKMNGGEMLSV